MYWKRIEIEKILLLLWQVVMKIYIHVYFLLYLVVSVGLYVPQLLDSKCHSTFLFTFRYIKDQSNKMFSTYQTFFQFTHIEITYNTIYIYIYLFITDSINKNLCRIDFTENSRSLQINQVEKHLRRKEIDAVKT